MINSVTDNSTAGAVHSETSMVVMFPRCLSVSDVTSYLHVTDTLPQIFHISRKLAVDAYSLYGSPFVPEVIECNLYLGFRGI